MNSGVALWSALIVFLAAAVLAWWVSFLFAAVVIGGAMGGLTLAGLGGEKYSLRRPGMGANQPMDPGFLGDVFVGIMAALVMFGMGEGVGTLQPFLVPQDASFDALVGLGVRNFAVAYLSGFLGLNLIKRLSSQLLDKAEIAKRFEEIGKTQTDTSYLLGMTAMRSGRLNEALQFMQDALAREGKTTIRPYVGIAQVLRRLQRWDEALQYLDTAISHGNSEQVKDRLAAAYYNRACLRCVRNGFVLTDEAERQVVADLTKAFEILPSLAQFAQQDEDLRIPHKNVKVIRELIDKMAMSPIPAPAARHNP